MPRVRIEELLVDVAGSRGQSFQAPFGHAGNRLHLSGSSLHAPSTRYKATRAVRLVLTMPSAHWIRALVPRSWAWNKLDLERGPWADEQWKGWWDNPPFHTPVFVLTHHPRPSIEMKGGTSSLPRRQSRRCCERCPGGRRRSRCPDRRRPVDNPLVRLLELLDYLHVTIVPIVLGAASASGTALKTLNLASKWSSSADPAASRISRSPSPIDGGSQKADLFLSLRSAAFGETLTRFWTGPHTRR